MRQRAIRRLAGVGAGVMVCGVIWHVAPLSAQAPWQVTGRFEAAAPGPLEHSTPLASADRPIPRRSYGLTPSYPPQAAAIGLRAGVRLRVVLDASGFVAERRVADAPVVAAFDPTRSNDERAVAAALESITSAALDAVRGWRYEAASAGPVAFDVTIHFGPETELRVETAVPRADDSTATAQRSPQPDPAEPLPDWARGVPRVGGPVRPPTRTTNIAPLYPAEARAAGVQGRVVIDARIDADGRVRNARVLESIPDLDQAALDAVLQWEFSPPLVSGASSAVLMTVTVQFTTR